MTQDEVFIKLLAQRSQTPNVAHLRRIVRARVVFTLTGDRPLKLTSGLLDRHLSLRIEHAFMCGSIQVLRNRVPHDTIYCLTFFASIGQAAQDRLRMVLNERLVIHIELANCFTPLAGQNLCSHQVLTHNVVLTQLAFRVHDSSQIVLGSDLI